MPKTVGVAVSNATFHFDKLYTYAVMPDQQNAVKLGSMVLVPFGRGSRARMGVVLACDAEPESAKLKYLFDVAPASACLTPELLRLVHFLKERTFCTYYEAVKAVIPYGAQYKPAVAADGVTPVLQKQLTRHTENSYRLVGGLPPKPKPTAKQLAAVALLGGGPRTLNELEDKGISRAVLDNLCAKGVLECSKVNKSIDLYSSIPLKNEPITLTQEQQAAYDALLPKLEDDAPHSALLYGVTGSGKTLVFLKLIARCLEQGRRALVLVPEISLTPQMILRLKSQFGRRVAVQHSALNHTERLLQWQMIQDGGADIVVGTRSAIFSPLENIGLIIIDEEQEHTYRSESAPRYSAHEVARQRAAENGALLLLASATPSTESFYAAQHGRTQLVRLTQRYGGNPLPTGQIVEGSIRFKAIDFKRDEQGKYIPVYERDENGELVYENVTDKKGNPRLDKDGNPIRRPRQVRDENGIGVFEKEEKVFDIAKMPIKEMYRLRGRQMSMVFQEPMTSLNPVFTIGNQLDEVTSLHVPGATKDFAKKRSIEMLNMVGIAMPERVYASYPHELSGGMRQRVMIAMALCCSPELLIADEPTTALDPTIQAQILELIGDLQRETGMTVVYITHDLGVVAETCRRAIVMYAGRVMETAGVRDLFRSPAHPYTAGLMKAMPKLNEKCGRLYSIEGNVPNFADMPAGCAFHDRCPVRMDICARERPGVCTVGPEHTVCCWRAQKNAAGGAREV